MAAKGFIFDLNGTMVDDMPYHTEAWYDILNGNLRAGLSREQVKNQMYGKNGELLERIFGKGHFTDTQVITLSAEKEKRYRQAFRPHLALIDGLPAFLKKRNPWVYKWG
jgi:beta-phosphoglucomutase-like phosphatase (HAD superfamily)